MLFEPLPFLSYEQDRIAFTHLLSSMSYSSHVHIVISKLHQVCYSDLCKTKTSG